MKNQSILIIDDEPDIRGLLSITVERMGYNAITADDVATGIAKLNESTVALCLTDLKLPDGSGTDIVDHIQYYFSHIPVIVITAHGSMDAAIHAMKKGAFDFINKPVELPQLRTLIQNALSTQNQNTINTDEATGIIGNSSLMMKLKEHIHRVARSQAPVFICGESGSGKELVARAIHKLSNRKEQPFIAVNCGAIPRELMESEFFGHKKGSFTGAHQDKMGLFQSAESGTLFLDEVADLPMDMQVKLLRAIQEKSIRPIGAQKEINIDVRILSATHKNLLSAIEQGHFRNDLYYRINVIELNVPPLRKRLDDLDSLISILLKKIADKNQTNPIAITPDAINALKQHSFPGNIRELENILERAHALTGNTAIDVEDLQLQTTQTHTAPNITSQQTNKPTATESTEYNPNEQSIDDYLASIESKIILKALEQNRWNRTATADVLGISFRSLRYRLKKLGIDNDD